MAQLAAVGASAENKSKTFEELDLALTGPQSSQLSSDTVSIDISDRRWCMDRSASVSSVAYAMPRSNTSGQLYHFGAPSRNLRSNPTGSKRGFDVNADEEDTPTKRAREISSSQQLSHAWGHSPLQASLQQRASSESQQIDVDQLNAYSFSDDLLASGQSSTSYADLCCGESDVFPERPLFHSATNLTQQSEPAVQRKLQRTNSEPPLHTTNPIVGEGQHDLLELIRNLYGTEPKLLPDPDYMLNHGPDHQPKLYIDQSMRMIVISWLVEVACEYELHQETLFLAAALMDRFMSVAKAVPRSNLQLISVACMLIASKHEEERHPSVQDFTSIADNCFQTGDLLKMESVVLQSLGFRINSPTSYTFLSLFLQGVLLTPKAEAMAAYFTELALLEYSVLNFPPSVVAAAAMLLAQSYEMPYTATSQLQRMSGYTPQVLGCCMEELLELQHRATDASDSSSPFAAVKDKYADPKLHCVSSAPPHTHLPESIYRSGTVTQPLSAAP